MATGAAMAGDDARATAPAAPVRRRPTAKGPHLFGIRAQRLVEAAYVALLGFLIVRLIWAFVTPIEAPPLDQGPSGGQSIDADLSVLSRFDPFGATRDAGPVEQSYAGAAETTLDLRLVGTTVGGGIKTATIELPDGKQSAFAIDSEVIGGVRLRDVLPNQAILNRNGLTETLTLKERDGAGGRSAAPRDLPANRRMVPAPVVPAPGNTPLSPGQALQALTRGITFTPSRDEEGRIAGYEIGPGPSPALFVNSGFAQGDVVTAVEGMPAPRDPEQLLELMADLPPGRPFTVTVERDGSPLDVPVDLRANQ